MGSARFDFFVNNIFDEYQNRSPKMNYVNIQNYFSMICGSFRDFFNGCVFTLVEFWPRLCEINQKQRIHVHSAVRPAIAGEFWHGER